MQAKDAAEGGCSQEEQACYTRQKTEQAYQKRVEIVVAGSHKGGGSSIERAAMLLLGNRRLTSEMSARAGWRTSMVEQWQN